MGPGGSAVVMGVWNKEGIGTPGLLGILENHQASWWSLPEVGRGWGLRAVRVDGSGKCPGYTLEPQEHFVFRRHAGRTVDLGPFTQCCRNSFPPAPVLSEATSPEEPAAR